MATSASPTSSGAWKSAEGVEARILGDAGTGENDDGTGYDLGGHVKEPETVFMRAMPIEWPEARHNTEAAAGTVG